MEMEITFPGGARVEANFDGFTLKPDQPVQGGGQGSAPTPFATFLASIGTCAGIYVLGFCQQRGIPTNGIKIVQCMHSDRATGLVGQIDLDIQLPPDFPEKYKAAVIRSAEQCAVKKHLEHPPAFNVTTSVVEAVAV
jgi:ribosomal protein S12 methylthiotransferase accessory factor